MTPRRIAEDFIGTMRISTVEGVTLDGSVETMIFCGDEELEVASMRAPAGKYPPEKMHRVMLQAAKHAQREVDRVYERDRNTLDPIPVHQREHHVRAAFRRGIDDSAKEKRR